MYVGTEKGLESKIVPTQGIPFKTINIQGFKRSLSAKNIQTVYLFIKSVGESKKIIKAFNPDVVMGTGGYVCGAVVYAASKLGIPTIIHEQNSVPGITNKFLAKYVTKVAICFPDTSQYFPSRKVELTGNPRAQEVVKALKSDVLKEYGLDPKLPTVLIFGGSQGAWTITKAMIEKLTQFSQKDYQILYATGDRYFADVSAAVAEGEIDETTLSICPYIGNMEEVLRNVDLVVSRAGATTMAELTALGLPSVLVPSPNVTNDHQTKNALSLVNVGAAKLIKDSELTGATLESELDSIMLNAEQRQDMSAAAEAEGIPDASDRLLKVIEQISQ